MKILVTGSQGQVGWELARALLPFGDIIAADRDFMDLSNLAVLRQTLQQIKPDIIVNAAAYTAVDKAESDQDAAFVLNTKVPEIMAEEAAKNRTLLIHYSTDYVFDGSKATAYNEADSTNPINVYGQSKLAGEQAIQSTDADYLIFRTSWVYGLRGQNFVNTILRLAAEREELNIVADQIGAPTWARLIAETTSLVLKQVLQEQIQGSFSSGIYNLTATGSTSWHAFAQAIVELARQQGADLKVQQINPIPTEAYPVPANRPKNSHMSTALLEQRFNLLMPAWETALKLCMQGLVLKQ
ncbi:MAG: dTDP-4-dehydrorhamnose reductase [Methylococcaceae bacterium]|jgi:dTDP-4-dehydrorhamnose reductase